VQLSPLCFLADRGRAGAGIGEIEHGHAPTLWARAYPRERGGSQTGAENSARKEARALRVLGWRDFRIKKKGGQGQQAASGFSSKNE